MFELPDEISPLTVADAPGAPHPLSLAELHSTGILNFVFTDNTGDRVFARSSHFYRSSDQAKAYADCHRFVRSPPMGLRGYELPIRHCFG